MALQRLEQALKLQGPEPALLHNRACALQDAGRITEALTVWKQALKVQPGFPPAALRLAAHWQAVGNWKGAEEVLLKSQQRYPDHSDVTYELARICERSDRARQALLYYKQVLAKQPACAKAFIGGGQIWLRQGQAENAARWFRESLRLDPQAVSAWNGLAQALLQQRAFDEAFEAYRQALRLAPDHFELLVNYGAALQEHGRLVEALEVHARARQLRSKSPVPHIHMGIAYAEMGHFERAFDCFHRAMAIDPASADARMNRGLLLVQHGRFGEGWDEYEWRQQTADAPRQRNLSCPEWDGTLLAGRRLLVHGEQGVGDEIMFATCLPDVVARAEHCVVTCDRRLAPLLARSFPRTTIVGVERGKEDWTALGQLADCHVPAGSLPRWLRRREADFPRRQTLLVADRGATDSWRERLAELGTGLKVGIAWHGGVKRPRGAQRSIDACRLRPIVRVPGVTFVNLQYGDVHAELEHLRSESGAQLQQFDELDLYHDLDGTAALISALDLVVAVGSATVHLAGALGTPTWCLLPRYWGWRWLIGRSESVWYPSVRLFRQREAGRWGSVLAAVGEELWRMAARRPRAELS